MHIVKLLRVLYITNRKIMKHTTGLGSSPSSVGAYTTSLNARKSVLVAYLFLYESCSGSSKSAKCFCDVCSVLGWATVHVKTEGNLKWTEIDQHMPYLISKLF